MPRWRGRESRAARRGARAAISRRSSARRGHSRRRLLPLAISSTRASPARCAPGIRGPRPERRCSASLRIVFRSFFPGGRRGSSPRAEASRRPLRAALPCGRRAGRRGPCGASCSSAPLPGPRRHPASSRIAAAAWMLPARPRPLRLRRSVRIRARDRRSMAPWIPARSRPPAGESHGGARGRRTPASGVATAAAMPGASGRGRSGAGKGGERQRAAARPGAARAGVSGAPSGRSGRPKAGGAGRATRRAILREGIRHRRRPVPECVEKSEAGRSRERSREATGAKAGVTPPSDRGPQGRRASAPQSDHAFGNTAFREPGARSTSRAGRIVAVLFLEPL